MTRALITLWNAAARERALKWVRQAPPMTRIEFKQTKRTLPQNSKLWSLLTEVATQKELGGKRLKPDVWKSVFMHELGREAEYVPSLDGQEIIPIGYSSSDLSKNEMSELIELILAWGAQNGVVFKYQEEEAK